MFERIRKLIFGPKRPELDPHQLTMTAGLVITSFFQTHGQSPQERVDAIKAAADLARVEVVFDIKDGVIAPYFPPTSPWPEFRRALYKCFPLGQFEREVAAVRRVIHNYYHRFD